MPIILDGGAGVTFPDTRQQTNAVTMTGGNPLYYAARAWVNFNGSNGAIRAAVNVATVSRSSTGIYTVTFTTAMPDANYAVIATAGVLGAATDMYYNARIYGTPSSSSVGILVVFQSSGNPTYVDPTYVHVAVFR